jgi:HSP90 family molecular chaperone
VRVSKRLVGSPAIALSSDSEMTVNMRRMMKALNRDGMAGPDPMPDIEINPDHALIVSLSKLSASDAELGKVVAQQVADQALAAAGLLDDPRMMLGRMTTLLEKLCGKA